MQKNIKKKSIRRNRNAIVPEDTVGRNAFRINEEIGRENTELRKTKKIKKNKSQKLKTVKTVKRKENCLVIKENGRESEVS